jgi:hypothetical protein
MRRARTFEFGESLMMRFQGIVGGLAAFLASAAVRASPPSR